MSKSIRYYYFTSIATVLVISVMVMGLVQITLASTYFREDKVDQLTQVVTGVVNGLHTGQIDFSDESRFTINAMASMADSGIYITDTTGVVQYCTEKSELLHGLQVSQPVLDEIYANGSYQELGRLGGLFATNYYTVAAPLMDAQGTITGFGFASSDATALKVYLSDMFSSFILSAGLVLLVASVLALFLANRTVLPIRRVSEAARLFGEGNYSARVPVEGDDEITQLAITFNEMASSFETTDLTRRSFMGNIAHELRTPMTTIKGFIDGMLDGTIPEAQHRKYLGIVSEEVGRLARLTQNMLDVSKLEAGEYIPNAKTFNIWDPLTQVFLSSEQRLDEKRVGVKGFDPGAQVPVLADEDFVHQVLFNLVDNAIKFSEEGSSISISVEAGKGFATIGIRNTGAGISPEKLPYIFDRFYKTDSSRGGNVRGSGLGLHICKVLVNLMGGRIWADSEENSWTQISFSLPLSNEKKGYARRS